MAGAFNECFSSSSSSSPGRANSRHVSSKNDNDHQLLAPSSENAVRHASEATGLGPVQNLNLNSAAAPGSSFNRQAAGYYPGAGLQAHPSAPMGNSAPLSHNHHNHIRIIPQFENTTTQSTGHDRTGVGGGRNTNIDAVAGDMMYAGSGGLPLPAEHHPTTVQPTCKHGGTRYAVETTRAYDTPSSLGLTEVVGLS